ncbi:hypothetical protein A2954_04250 [Candidatus Roizmanbacteria bacterium RIFCSPLOWO2_01_FULL_37_12]|uniref:Mur ligase central domain-containing protein n=1 Tax=Candidatus Roizmanbacteria bacterium RIFCSPLOWO2_01_FULL_37_12 TaxID=1802056 RepID=A0A1F7IFR2_9BACT|nr:MAG: hypothetical protein A3D76_06160 [Candidatus Roizmanbacteria bacterium RIFCSPHIGHO2_02_FULL_37_9b]OGK42195.1 MAG: hypothetical protein A2954_04250 [Candidatus Roizmanbacteria bacterium RIFCSPLOWO2_01_FULL_37_12]
MISIFLLIAGLTVYLLKSLDFIYLFQTKEYRVDRIMSFLNEENFLSLLYFRKIRMPGISLRNLLITQIIFLNSLLFTFFLLNQSQLNLLIFLLLTPPTAFLTMLLGVFISEIPVQIYRKKIIQQAKIKVAASDTVFIGITGSYGKTSTKEFLYQILSQKYKVAKTDKNNNSEIGVAISILKNLKPDTEYFIAELGAYRKGEIKATRELIHPKYGILTGIGNQHLGLFGSKENLLQAKAELLESLAKEGIAYINKDIKEWKYFADKTRVKKVFYSIKNLPFEIKTNLPGKHNLQNLLPCIALASHLGITKEQIQRVLINLKPVAGRLSFDKGINGSTILNDSYNSNIEGFSSAIETAQILKNFSKKLIMSRGLIELGVEKKQSYQTIINILYKTDLTLITTDNLFKSLDTKNKVRLFNNESLILNYIKEVMDNKTLLVVEGRFEPDTLHILFANN